MLTYGFVVDSRDVRSLYFRFVKLAIGLEEIHPQLGMTRRQNKDNYVVGVLMLLE